jgi:hypothetical protein
METPVMAALLGLAPEHRADPHAVQSELRARLRALWDPRWAYLLLWTPLLLSFV